MCPIPMTWETYLGPLPPVLKIDNVEVCGIASKCGAPAVRLPDRVRVNRENVDLICKFLALNHDRYSAEVYCPFDKNDTENREEARTKDRMKDEVMYGCSTFAMGDLDVALDFFKNTPQPILSKLRTIVLTVERYDILKSSKRLLRALQVLADCPPKRRIQDLCLTVTKNIPVKMATKTKPVWIPSFTIWGFLGLRLRINVRALRKGERLTLEDMQNWLGRIPQGSRVNFLDKLPNELLDMIYNDIVPQSRSTTGRGRGRGRWRSDIFALRTKYLSTWMAKPSSWDDVKNVLKVCPEMAFGVIRTTSYQQERARKRKIDQLDYFATSDENCLHRSKRLAISPSLVIEVED